MSIPEKSEHFVSVIEANKGIIYKVVNSYCKNEVERKDLVQEIVMQLWKSFDNYRYYEGTEKNHQRSGPDPVGYVR